jgi:hypothetical protein
VSFASQKPWGHAQLIEDRAVRIDLALHPRLEFELRDEEEVLRPRPPLQEVLEGLADDLLAVCAREAAQAVEFVEIVLDQQLAHGSDRSLCN